ncbi:protease [Catellatospora sp. TT07R-123]|uniref:S8 family peptidase n=1 Tax=Catellatospora sp. TT07R-123 TaxID=2733863 RepID=UPI001B22435B|nr:S8/S53 family peptidase [Catellatospora sp. TT07R-123]GHJ43439.1 protease [Catellatospora sp. TT07R-123]
MPGLVAEESYDRFWQQFDVVRAALAQERDGAPAIAIEAATDNGVPLFVYEKSRLLFEDVTDSVDYMRGRFGADRITEAGPGVHLADLGGGDALGVLRDLEAERGGGWATPHHILSITGDVNLCPADEPTLPLPGGPMFYPTTVDHHAGDGVRIEIIDTGLAQGWERFTWLAGITGDDRLTPPPGEVPMYYGHGTFVAGVLRRVAPMAAVHVANNLRRAGALHEVNLVEALSRIMSYDDDQLPHIISLSAGGSTRDDLPLLSIHRQLSNLQSRGVLLVAAAGNDGNDRGFWPAAFEGVLSVGALREDLTGRACFSNHGSWVDCYAPGERLVNAFPDGAYRYYHEGRETCRYRRRSDPAWYAGCTCVTAPNAGTTVQLRGRARWSGTSFATPIVAGLVAARMSASGDSSRDAADWLLANPAGWHPELGPVLLPGQAIR